MKKLLIALLLLTLALCPLLAMADGLTAELIRTGEETVVFFTDEEGDMYLLVIGEDGVTATKVGSSLPQQQTPAVTAKPSVSEDKTCWRCGESLGYGDHTAGNCGYKYHSACTDKNFKDELGHELCPICNKCMYSSGSRHGVGYGLCGATWMLEEGICKFCNLPYAQHPIHSDEPVPPTNCTAHCWIEDAPHAACPICTEPLCNGEEHSAKGCAKKLQSVG